MIRQAAFKGLREDKKPRDVVAETAQADTIERAKQRAAPQKSRHAAHARHRPSTVMGVTISKPDKALWPDAGDGRPVTKLDLARYYEQVGEWMLPHLDRSSLLAGSGPERHGGQQFFQRHAMAGMSELFRLREGAGRQGTLRADRSGRGLGRRGANRRAGNASLELRARRSGSGRSSGVRFGSRAGC